MKKLFILGLDSATPQLVFDRYIQELPTFAGLIKTGRAGFLRSTIPPVTVPAWMAMMTGKDPGQLGFYGFTDRIDYSYQINTLITHASVKSKTIWDYLGESGYRSIVMNLPQTYPPKEINGIMISSFLTPDKLLSYTYPDEIKDELDSIADGNYIIDAENFRTTDKQKLLSELYEMTEKRFKIIRNFIKNKDWELFIAVEMGIDRLHHGFWSFCFEDHRLYDDQSEFKNSILDFYKYIDKELRELIRTFDDDTELMIVSDHGAKNLKGTFCINDWLVANGYLKLKDDISGKTKFATDNVDWANTTAWGDGGYYCKIYFNIQDRERTGKITEEELPTLKKELADKISTLIDPDGNAVKSEIYDTQYIYKELNGCPPDLIILIGNLDWRVTNSVGNENLFIYENTTIDNANHDMNGIVIYCATPKSAIEGGDRLELDFDKLDEYSILDIAPTALNRFNIEIPNDLYGKIIN